MGIVYLGRRWIDIWKYVNLLPHCSLITTKLRKLQIVSATFFENDHSIAIQVGAKEGVKLTYTLSPGICAIAPFYSMIRISRFLHSKENGASANSGQEKWQLEKQGLWHSFRYYYIYYIPCN